MSLLGRQLEQTPIDFGEPSQKLAQLKVIARHGADLRDKIFAHVLGDGLLVHLRGEVIAALRGILVQRALEEIQDGVDLVLELFLAEPEVLSLLIHKYTYIYAY